MLSCWNEDSEKRLTFSQLYRALKQLDGEIEVNCTQKLICAVVSPHPSFNTFSLDYSNTILYFTIPGLHQPDDIQWKSVRERLMPLR